MAPIEQANPRIFCQTSFSLNITIPTSAVITKLICEIGTMVLAGPDFKASSKRYSPKNKKKAAEKPK